MSTKVQLIGGSFQDIEGNPVVNGYMILELWSDQQVVNQAQIAGQVKVKVTLDINGDVFGTRGADTPKQYVWPNDVLNPAGFYVVSVYNTNGKLVWGPQFVTIASSPSPFNVSAWVPLSPNWSNNNTTTSLLLQTNTVNNQSQTLLNLVGAGEVTVTDNGAGTITISAPVIPVTLGPVVDITCYVPSTLAVSQTLLHFNSVRSINFAVDLVGSYATSLAAATGSAVIDIKKNSTLVGTITFGAGLATGVFSANPAITLVAGDKLDFVSASADATLSGVSFTITGTRIN